MLNQHLAAVAWFVLDLVGSMRDRVDEQVSMGEFCPAVTEAAVAKWTRGPAEWKRAGAVLLASSVLAGVWFFPFGDLPEGARQAVALILFSIVLWVARPWSPVVTGILFVLLAWLSGAAVPLVAFSGMASPTTWFVWGALVLALAVQKTGLDVRLAGGLLARIQVSARGLIGLQYLSSWALSYVIPSSTARVAVLAPIAASQVNSLGLSRNSQAAKMSMVSLVLVNWLVGQGLITGGNVTILVWGLLQQSGIRVSWLQWWWYCLLPMLAALAVLFFGCVLVFRPEAQSRHAVSQGASLLDAKEYAPQRPWSGAEIRLLVWIGLTLLFWTTEGWHSLQPPFVAILAGIGVLLPRVGVLSPKEGLLKVGWSTVLYVAAAISVGNVAQHSGAAEWLVVHVRRWLMSGSSEFGFLMMLIGVGLLGRMLLRSAVAIVAVLFLPCVQLAQSLGYDATLVGIAFPLCLTGLFIYQHSFGLIAYDYGSFEESDFVLASTVRLAAVAAALVIGYFVWWPLVGLL